MRFFKNGLKYAFINSPYIYHKILFICSLNIIYFYLQNRILLHLKLFFLTHLQLTHSVPPETNITKPKPATYFQINKSVCVVWVIHPIVISFRRRKWRLRRNSWTASGSIWKRRRTSWGNSGTRTPESWRSCPPTSSWRSGATTTKMVKKFMIFLHFFKKHVQGVLKVMVQTKQN